MKNLAIIPARSGSKRVKDKNIRDLNGKPLMAYTIEAAVDSGVFSRVMVSTDSTRYAEIAVRYGAEVPFIRSNHNATDSAGTWDTVDEVLKEYAQRGEIFDNVCVLQPTSPLRSSRHIQEAYELFCNKAKVAVVSVCETEHTLVWYGQLDDSHSLDRFVTEDDIMARQSKGVHYRVNGGIYFISVAEYSRNKWIYREGSYAYLMDQMHSVDIDTESDFVLAGMILNCIKE